MSCISVRLFHISWRTINWTSNLVFTCAEYLTSVYSNTFSRNSSIQNDTFSVWDGGNECNPVSAHHPQHHRRCCCCSHQMESYCSHLIHQHVAVETPCSIFPFHHHHCAAVARAAFLVLTSALQLRRDIRDSSRGLVGPAYLLERVSSPSDTSYVQGVVCPSVLQLIACVLSAAYNSWQGLSDASTDHCLVFCTSKQHVIIASCTFPTFGLMARARVSVFVCVCARASALQCAQPSFTCDSLSRGVSDLHKWRVVSNRVAAEWC